MLSVGMVLTGNRDMTINAIIAAELKRTKQDGNVFHINPALARLAAQQEATPAEVDKYTKAESSPLNNALSTLSMEVQDA